MPERENTLTRVPLPTSPHLRHSQYPTLNTYNSLVVLLPDGDLMQDVQPIEEEYMRGLPPPNTLLQPHPTR